jgi:hypothetical protein
LIENTDRGARWEDHEAANRESISGLWLFFDLHVIVGGQAYLMFMSRMHLPSNPDLTK